MVLVHRNRLITELSQGLCANVRQCPDFTPLTASPRQSEGTTENKGIPIGRNENPDHGMKSKVAVLLDR